MGRRIDPFSDTKGGIRLHKTWARWTVVAPWLPYTTLNTIFPGLVAMYELGLALLHLAEVRL